MGWLITHDMIHTGDDLQYRKVGQKSRGYKGGGEFYRMLDDDRNPYFTFKADSDTSAENLFDQLSPLYGCTILQYRAVDGDKKVWKDMISG